MPVPDLLIFGEALFDCFEDGSKVLGGAPFNVAWHLRGFNTDPVFMSQVGTDSSGEQLKQRMTTWGVRTDQVYSDPQRPTGHVKVSIINGQPSYEIPPDQAWDYIRPSSLLSTQPTILYHGSLALRNHVSKNTLEALATDQGNRVFLDVNLRSPWWSQKSVMDMVKHCTWLKLNDEELKLLAGKEDTEQAVASFFGRFTKLSVLFLTQGEHGATAFPRNEARVRVHPDPSNSPVVIDTVGAGDSFSAVLMLGFYHEWPLALSMQRAQDFAGAIVAQRGATALNRALYESFLKEWRVPSDV